MFSNDDPRHPQCQSLPGVQEDILNPLCFHCLLFIGISLLLDIIATWKCFKIEKKLERKDGAHSQLSTSLLTDRSEVLLVSLFFTILKCICTLSLLNEVHWDSTFWEIFPFSNLITFSCFPFCLYLIQCHAVSQMVSLGNRHRHFQRENVDSLWTRNDLLLPPTPSLLIHRF